MARATNPAPLTSTSFAILGLLAIRPWTTYELAKQMDRAMGAFWPRAESKLYEEPKKLVAHGLATATEERVGRRPRTVYAITPKGRRAMAAWLPEPAAGPVVEFEGLLKVFFAEHGTKDDLLNAIATAGEWVDRRYREGEGISRGYLDGEGPYPERLPWLILTGAFLQEITDAVDRWSEWARRTVEAWPEDVRQAEPDLVRLEEMARAGDAHLPQVGERATGG
jgi:DNA-binding PadR family transcriptional regulator